MRWRLRISEFTIDIVYKRWNLNFQADALSQLKFLEHTAMPIDEKILTYPDDHTTKRVQIAL